MTPADRAALRSWVTIPRRIRKAIAGLSSGELKVRGGSAGWSIREYVHHLVEANLVASNVVLAALGDPGCEYDWSWLVPDARWMRRLGYGRAPLEPGIQLLESLCSHVAGLVRRSPDGLARHVRLRGTRSKIRRRTVRQLLEDECEHAGDHLRDIAAVRSSIRVRRL